MYPLNVKLPAPQIGFAVANTEEEHQTLTAMGYEPAYVAPVAATGEKTAKTAKAAATAE